MSLTEYDAEEVMLDINYWSSVEQVLQLQAQLKTDNN